MAVLKRNYIPGEYEEVSKEEAGVIDYNEFQYFAFEGYFKFDVAEIQVFATDSKTLVDPANYTLVVDQKYTDLEESYSGLTLYAMIKFTEVSLDGEPFFVTGKNFGTMVDNEDMKRYVDDRLSLVGGSSREFHATALISGADWSNTTTSISIESGVGKVVNAYDDPSTPVEVIVPIPEQTITPSVDPAFTGNVFVYVDQNGFLQTQFAPLTYAQLRDSFSVALAVYDLGLITAVFSLGIYVNNFLNVLRDYVNFLPLEERINGVEVREVTGVLSIWVTAGEFFLPGGNRKVTKKSENVIPLSQQGDESTPVAFTVIDRFSNVIATNETVIPDYYDDGSGSPGNPNTEPLTGNNASINYFFYQADGGYFLQLGQIEYSNGSTAKQELELDARFFQRAERVAYAVVRAQIYRANNADDFEDADDAGIVNIGETGGGSGGAGQGLGEVLANSPDANEIGMVNLLGMRTSGVINQSGLWQIRKPAGGGAVSDYDVSGSSSELVNGSYAQAGTRDAGGSYGVFPYFSNGEGFFITRDGWWWLICTNINDAWNTGAHYGAGGLSTPASFYNPITANGYTGDAEVVVGGGSSSEVDSLVAEGNIYSDEVIKARVGLNVGNSLSVQEDRIELLNLASVLFNVDGTISLPSAGTLEISDPKDVVTLEKLQESTGQGGQPNSVITIDDNGDELQETDVKIIETDEYVEIRSSAKMLKLVDGQNPTTNNITLGKIDTGDGDKTQTVDIDADKSMSIGFGELSVGGDYDFIIKSRTGDHFVVNSLSKSIVVPLLTSAIIDLAGDQSLVTKKYVDENDLIPGSGFQVVVRNSDGTQQGTPKMLILSNLEYLPDTDIDDITGRDKRQIITKDWSLFHQRTVEGSPGTGYPNTIGVISKPVNQWSDYVVELHNSNRTHSAILTVGVGSWVTTAVYSTVVQGFPEIKYLNQPPSGINIRWNIVTYDRGGENYTGIRMYNDSQGDLKIKIENSFLLLPDDNSVYEIATEVANLVEIDNVVNIVATKEYVDQNSGGANIYDFGWTSSGKYVGAGLVYLPSASYSDLSFSGATSTSTYSDIVVADGNISEIGYVVYGSVTQDVNVSLRVNGVNVWSGTIAGGGSSSGFITVNPSVSVSKGDSLIPWISSTATGVTINGIKAKVKVG